ncbi:phosphoribosyl pyrophosphate synthase-associated protein 2-like isoform X1 [Lytechinus pictus]|uniref:phosphoribosyl pyrophosphate synthase-associated protein 2-like isoform X1 n=1 Tax=Lytechinus pictus TaxID=7653 RepID=UPI0030B9EF7A
MARNACNRATGLLFFSGNSHPELSNSVARRLGVELGQVDVYTQDNKETKVQIQESVRGKDIFILQTGAKDVNNAIMELLIIAYACKTSSARSIVAVIPYLPYSKQSQMRKRGSIVAKLLATMLCKAGVTHVITMDLHHKEIQGFFDVPVDNLRASPFLVQYIQEHIPDWRNAVIVARNPGSAKRATSYAERLRLGLAVIHGEQKESESDRVDGRHSPPPVAPGSSSQALGMPGLPSKIRLRSTKLVFTPKEKPPINVVGDVGGRIAIIVDDMIDEAESFVAAAELVKDRGAYKIYIIATHGLLSSEAPKIIEDSCIDEVIVTNTVSHDLQRLQCNKLRTVDISLLLSESIRRIHYGESMSYLFRNIPLED